MKEAGEGKDQLKSWVHPPRGGSDDEDPTAKAAKPKLGKDGKPIPEPEKPKMEYGPEDQIHPDDEDRLEDGPEMRYDPEITGGLGG